MKNNLDRLFDLRQRNPSLSRKDLAKWFNCSVSTVSRRTKGWQPYGHEKE